MYVVFADQQAEAKRQEQSEQRQRRIVCMIFVAAFVILYGVMSFIHNVP